MAVFTPQRAAFPLHQDNYAFIPDSKVLPGVLAQLREEERMPDIGDLRLEVHNPPTFFHKSPASFNDPMSIFYVVNAMLLSQRGHYIRPTYLVPYLRDHVHQFYWSSNVVGRIVAGVQMACSLMYEDEGHAIQNGQYDATWLPIGKGRDSHGAYYVLDPRGGDEGLLWLAGLRDGAFKLSRRLLAAERDGVFEEEGVTGKGVVAHEFIMEMAPNPIRSASAYLAQTHPGRKFSHVLYDPTNDTFAQFLSASRGEA